MLKHLFHGLADKRFVFAHGIPSTSVLVLVLIVIRVDGPIDTATAGAAEVHGTKTVVAALLGVLGIFVVPRALVSVVIHERCIADALACFLGFVFGAGIIVLVLVLVIRVAGPIYATAARAALVHGTQTVIAALLGVFGICIVPFTLVSVVVLIRRIADAGAFGVLVANCDPDAAAARAAGILGT